MVAPDEPRDVRRQVDQRARGQRKADLGAAQLERLGHRGHVRRPAQLAERQADEHVVHGRIAHRHGIDQLCGRGADLVTQLAEQPVDAVQQPRVQIPGGCLAGVGVRDTAHDVLAEGRLRIRGGSLGHRLAGFEVDEVGRQFGGADVDGRAKRRRPGRKQGDDPAGVAVYRRPHRPAAGTQGIGGLGQHGQAHPGRGLACRGDRVLEAAGVAAQVVERGWPDLDIKRYDGRIERRRGYRLAFELQALGSRQRPRRNVHPHVRDHGGLAGETDTCGELGRGQQLALLSGRRREAPPGDHPAAAAQPAASADRREFQATGLDGGQHRAAARHVGPAAGLARRPGRRAR